MLQYIDKLLRFYFNPRLYDQIFPVGISILASFTSAIAILGFSWEMYRYGTMYWIVVFSYPLTQGVAALVYVPLFHRLKLTSAYEYLELRFNHKVKVAASAVFSVQMVCLSAFFCLISCLVYLIHFDFIVSLHGCGSLHTFAGYRTSHWNSFGVFNKYFSRLNKNFFAEMI